MRIAIIIAWLLAVPASGIAAMPDASAGSGNEDELSAEEVRTAASAFLADRFPAHAPKLDVRVVRVRAEAPQTGMLSIRLPRADGVPRGHTQVRIVVEDENIGWALLYVAHFDSVAVLRTDVDRDDSIDASDVGFAWMDVTTFRGDPFTSASASLLKESTMHARKPLRAGDALRIGDIRPPWAADTGEQVVMTYRRASVVLRLSCTAREPGTVGDVIRVYSADTRTTYKAQLTGEGTAAWTATL